MPFVLIPQVWKRPALTAVKVPAGGVARSKAFEPQQARVPFVLIAQVWALPALTAVKVPAGGVDWPLPLLAPAGEGAVRPDRAGVPAAGAQGA